MAGIIMVETKYTETQLNWLAWQLKRTYNPRVPDWVLEQINVLNTEREKTLKVDSIPNLSDCSLSKCEIQPLTQDQQQDLSKLDKSTAYTSLGISEAVWSTAYTVECDPIRDELVSKSIDIKKDTRMSEETIDTRPVHIYFMKEIPETVSSERFKEIEPTLSRKIVCCTNWAEMAEMFKLNPTSLCVNSAQLHNQSLIEIINMVETFSKLVGIEHDIAITLGVNNDTPYQIVKESQKLKIQGIIPASKDFGMDETMKGCNASWNNIPYWPKYIIEQLPGAKKTNRQPVGEIKLTPRQDQILYLIRERGSSNKVIAKTLNITESTVKLHVGLILKKFGVKNRTQLAVFSRK